MLKFDLDGQGGQFDKDQILRRADYGQVKHISSWAPGSWPKFAANADFLAEFTLEINVANPPLGAASFVSFRFTSRDLDRSFQFTTLPLFGLPR